MQNIHYRNDLTNNQMRTLSEIVMIYCQMDWWRDYNEILKENVCFIYKKNYSAICVIWAILLRSQCEDAFNQK